MKEKGNEQKKKLGAVYIHMVEKREKDWKVVQLAPQQEECVAVLRQQYLDVVEAAAASASRAPSSAPPAATWAAPVAAEAGVVDPCCIDTCCNLLAGLKGLTCRGPLAATRFFVVTKFLEVHGLHAFDEIATDPGVGLL
jgi:hypothetical protein